MEIKTLAHGQLGLPCEVDRLPTLKTGCIILRPVDGKYSFECSQGKAAKHAGQKKAPEKIGLRPID